MKSATPAHAEALALIHERAFPPGEQWNAAAMAGLLALRGTFGFVAEEGGMVLARVAADEGEVLTIAVVPEQRGHGLGRRLLEATLAEATRRGAASLVLEVAEANVAARALYARLLFRPVGRRTAYYADGGDALILRRPSGSAAT